MINATTEQQCKAHHYRIEEANGTPKVWGRCQVCGYARMYNAGDQYAGAMWHNSNGERYVPNGSGERYVP